MAAEGTRDWPTIASYMGLYGDARADLLLLTLQGSGIPAVRRPSLPMSWLPVAAWPMIQPAQVLVPPDREDDPRELADEQPYRPVHPLMRRVGQWIIAAVLVNALGAPLAQASVLSPTSGAAGALTAAYLLAMVMVLITAVRLVAALAREGVLHLDVRPLIVALGFYGLLALLTLAIWWLQGRLATPAPY